ncbi:uncharacterized protein PRCAT00003623001 [Priceomyces carsonii]|uniref:uncharacterized protein n=1 Tax=Priceomyces carsonii TaxID=28549 RepID=UPI002ED8A9CC|nr:unnamed protein product [Priceomyces carsonii]
MLKMVEFFGKLCLAPMVRSGELPTRLMALKYGADLVWSPEIVDKKIIKCDRVVNEDLKTIDFVEVANPEKVAFRTFPNVERDKLIFQIGSADPELAVLAGLKVVRDVAGIDLNCGCPKPFSTHSGMGAALLKTPDLLEQILLNLVEKVGKPFNKPISCKIRLLNDDDPNPTIDLVNRICKTGILNLTLHCRTPSMRNREYPVRKFLPEIIASVSSHNVSLIVNGNIQSRNDLIKLQSLYGPKVGGMIAESAESNPTVFLNRPLPYNEVIYEFITIARKFRNHPSNTKYILLNQLPGKSKYYQMFCQAKTNEEFLEIAEALLNENDCKILFKFLQKDRLVNPIETIEMKKHDVDDRVDMGNKKKLKSLISAV